MSMVPYNVETCPDPIAMYTELGNLIQARICAESKSQIEYCDTQINLVINRLTNIEVSINNLVDEGTRAKLDALVAALAPLDPNEDGQYGDLLIELQKQTTLIATAQAAATSAAQSAAAAQGSADSANTRALNNETAISTTNTRLEALASQVANLPTEDTQIEEARVKALALDVANQQICENNKRMQAGLEAFKNALNVACDVPASGATSPSGGQQPAQDSDVFSV